MRNPAVYPRPHRTVVRIDDLDANLQTKIAGLENKASDRKRESYFTVPICVGVVIYAVIEFAAAVIADLTA